MGKCTIDHSYEDVKTKLDNQSPYMPDALVQEAYGFLQQTIIQETLNELFHLLKKYDLASEQDRRNRDAELRKLMQS
ncbi:50S ribosomal protein L7ae [Bacillus hwajinpoensis]|uniref:50S ribosomal protein L7ae n=1 Tax=Guptibacillus hwajinpoensis TaxID=208199 RepID=A0A845F1B6_9BACL|nr:50S ribosomal protein L7ae [Pseudalkalibacillus hwajinpoensis]MYL64534.1 50S ribosomal protein L7ae [Pseudalkalibacillus hwajinpoensis]